MADTQRVRLWIVLCGLCVFAIFALKAVPTAVSRITRGGVYADLIAQRFRSAVKRLGHPQQFPELDCSRFTPTGAVAQMDLF
ncbi:MAG: hypothetical protein AB1768_11600 [Pseudomonadota bacterium]|jgi:hypothetical protein